MNCPECNSKIVEGEPFCPVCGIALAVAVTPVEPSAPAVPAEEEFDSTIMMSSEELAQHAAAIAKGDTISKEVLIPETTRTDNDAEAVEIADEVVAAETEPAAESLFEGAPEPELPVIDFNDTKSGSDARPTADYALNTSPTAEGIGSELDDDVDFGLPDTEPEVVIPPDVPDVSIHDTSMFPDPVFLVDQSVAPKPEELIPEPEPEIEPVIEKPSIDLPLEEFASSNPIYDSVRIVAPDVPDSQDQVSTRVSAAADPRAKSSETPPEPAPDLRNPTTPSIGVGDTGGRKTSKLMPLAEGAILNNRYEIIRKIGGGGMGAVYLASDNNLGGVLRAVKEMVQAHIEEDQQEKSINDFKRESMILSSLDHPSIPTIFDYFFDESEGRFYLVMKYISGGDLSARIRSAPEGKIDEITVIEWSIQVIDVLNYLHNQPSTIVYRDLKPSNIMIDGNTGRVMLIDFGIARAISQKEEKGVTAVGTMGYAPPELFSGNVEPRSDIYSLGSTMFHLLTGADPQSNPLLIFDFQKNPRPRQINPRLSDQIEKILMRSVEYSAEARFASAGEMRQILEQHLTNLKSGNVTFGVSEAPEAVSLEDQFVFCGFCGQRIVATDMFCAFCGAKQPIAQQGVHSGQYVRGAVTAKLLVEGTTELPMPAYSLQKDENLVGRRDPMSNIFPEVDLSKFDPQTKISRRHARIWRNGDQFLLEDLGSSNGTMLSIGGAESMRLLPHKPQILSAGDKIRVGDATLHFVLD